MAPKKPSFIRTLLSFHRYIGLSVAIIAIHLSITGILLNHTNDIGVDKNYISSSTILGWYGIKQPDSLPGHKLDDHWISQWNENIYFNQKIIGQSINPLRGATTTEHFYALATSETIWLITIDGDIIEKLNAPGEKLGDIIQLGQQDKFIVIKTEQGLFKADADLVSWQPIENTGINWSKPDDIPAHLSESIFAQGHSISWERVLLDVHSGRIISQGGVIIIDLAGILLIILAVTGTIIWYKRRRRKLT